MTILVLLFAAVVMLLLAVAMAWVLGWANRAFHVEVDERIDRINAVLPGANCGGCGFVGCIVCPGVTIGNRCIIGAGAVVTKDVPDDTIAVGNPARHKPCVPK